MRGVKFRVRDSDFPRCNPTLGRRSPGAGPNLLLYFYENRKVTRSL